MKMSLLLVAIVFTLTSPVFAEGGKKKADSREKLETAIPDAIKMLKEKKYAAFLNKFAKPDDLEKILKRVTIDEFAKKFGEGKAENLLAMLNAVKNVKPSYNEDKTMATYQIEKKISNRDKITFQKVEKYWYIKN